MSETEKGILCLGILVLYGFLTFLLLAKGDKASTLKNKIINPPEFFPCGILFFVSTLLAFIFSIGKYPAISLFFIMVGIGTIILRSQQAQALTQIYQYQQTKDYVIKSIKTKNDDFKKSYYFQGPDIFCKTSIGQIRCHCIAMGSQDEKGFLSLTGTFNHKYNFSPEAYDNLGNKIYLASHIEETVTSYQESYHEADREITNKIGDVIGTIEGQTHYETKYRTAYSEIFGIYMSLKQAKETEEGYQIKLYGDKEIIIDIPRWYVLAFVEGLEQKPEFNKIEWQ